MGWIIVLLGIALLVVLIRRNLDRETTRNLKFLSKVVAILLGSIVLIALFSYIIH